MDYEAFIGRFNRQDLFSSSIGIELLSVNDGGARASLTLNEKVLNFMGGMHGGALYTLADIVCGCAVVYHGRAPVTLDADIRYLRPVTSGRVVATATEIKSGRSVCVIRADIHDGEGRLCCVCNVTMYLTDTSLSELENEVN